VAAKPANNPDQDMSEALVKKINKSSGDIVLRSSDLPPPFPAPKAEAKPEVKSDVKVEKKAEAKPKEPTKAETPVIRVKEELIPETPWTYADGPAGPENWVNLRKENQLCAKGKMQSPININFDNTVKGNLSPLLFEYRPFFLSLMDNGRTLEVIGAEGNNITLNEKQYRLLGFNIHKPSKTAFNGERAEMSIQLVHQHFDGSKVIVEVMLSSSPKLFEVAKKSWWDSAPKENPLFQVLLNHVPLVKNQVASPRDVAINPQQLLPEDRTYFTYMGSLTEPPCNEGVTWIVMKNPILVSAQQVHSFGQIYNNNVRPLQIKGDRIIKESR
jgi:carbonic anhydrase